MKIRDWSKSIGGWGGGGGWAGAFGNVVDKKYMTHPLPPSQKGLTHPLVKTRMFGFL